MADPEERPGASFPAAPGVRPGNSEAGGPNEDTLTGADRSGLRRGLVLAFGLVVLAAALFFALSPGVYLGDDAFITLTYARNLAAGEGLVFNAGERVWGFTSPLQTLLLAGVDAIGLDPIRLATLLAPLELGGALLLLLRLVPSATGVFGPVAVLVVFLHVRLHLFPGLEGTLLVLFQVSVLAALAAGRSRWAALLAAASCLARPDSVLFVAPLLLLDRRLRQPVPWLLFALPGVLWLGFALVYYGDWLPNTLGAKTGIEDFVSYVEQGWQWVTAVSLSLFGETPRWLRVGLLLANLSLLLQPAFRRQPWLLWALVAWPWVLIGAYAVIGPPHYYRWEIYSAHLFFTAGWALGIAGLLWQGSEWLRRRWPGAVVARSIAAGLFVAGVLLLAAPSYWRTVGDMQSNFVVGSRFQTYRAIAGWLEANVEDGAAVAHYEVGALGYYTRRIPIVDLGGLVSRRPEDAPVTELPERMLLEHRPTYLLRVVAPGSDRHRVADLRYREVHRFPDYGYYPFALHRLRVRR